MRLPPRCWHCVSGALGVTNCAIHASCDWLYSPPMCSISPTLLVPVSSLAPLCTARLPPQRCFLALAEQMSKHMLMLKDASTQEILAFLDAAGLPEIKAGVRAGIDRLWQEIRKDIESRLAS